MPLEIEGEKYYSASEAAKYLGISRPTFYQNIQPNIPEYKHGAMKRMYYRLSDLEKYKGVIRVESNKEDQ